jgi:hypothetical protein
MDGNVIFEQILLNIKKMGFRVLKIVSRRVCWTLGPTGKQFLAQGKKEVGPP